MTEITPKEQKFLDALKEQFDNKKGKLGDKEQAIYDAVAAEFEKDGQTGLVRLNRVIESAIDKAVSSGKKTGLGKIINRNTGGLGSDAEEASLTNKVKPVLEKARKAEAEGGFGFPENDEKTPKKVVEPTNTEPTKTETNNSVTAGSIEELILKAAQKNGDKKLDATELGTLLNSQAFKDAANKIAGGAKISIKNEADDAKDAIIIENDDNKKTVTLSKIDPSLRFTDDVASGVPKTPASNGGKNR